MVGLVRGFKGLKIPSSFTVSSNTQSIQIDHPYQILWTLLPEDATNTDIFWSSSDESIATVDEGGLITPVSVGECTITGHTASNWLMQTIAVTTYVVHTTGVSLDKDSIVVLPNASVQLTATVTPYNTNFPEVTWSSSDTSIATVDDNGLVSYVSVGNCTITCTTVDGGYIDTCDVEAGIPVTGISLNYNSGEVQEDSPLQLVATITPSDASNKNVTWSSSNSSIAAVSDNGLVTYVADGNCTITCTTVDGGFTATCSITASSFTPVDRCFGYTGAQQSILLKAHKYCLEVWGASGGCGNASSQSKGGYSGGCITLNTDTCVYIYVGGMGCWLPGQGIAAGGYNGGGYGSAYSEYWAGGGGGGTDIRIGGNTLYHRRIVAGGGGGGGCYNSTHKPGGAGGGCNGVNGQLIYSGYHAGGGGTQTSGGCTYACGVSGSFGQGGMNTTCGRYGYSGGGGGGGWYGGGAGEAVSATGGGGSGYVYNSSTCSNAPSGYSHCTAYYLTNAYSCCGAVSFPSPSGGTETGHTGHGCVRIRSID